MPTSALHTLNDKISIFCFIMVSCYKKLAVYQSEIRFDPNIPDLEDLAIPNAILSVNKLLKLFYTIYYDILLVYP
jgi:hypothetical protein